MGKGRKVGDEPAEIESAEIEAEDIDLQADDGLEFLGHGCSP